MAKKVRFPLEMRNGIMVRTLQDLIENFDLQRVMEYVNDGKMEIWLRDRMCSEMADQIHELDVSDEEAEKTVCKIIFSADIVAFDQEDLYDILGCEEEIVYLFGEKFEIPLEKNNITYIGLNNPIIVINSKEIVPWKEKGICIKNCMFDEQYQQLVEREKAEPESRRMYRKMKKEKPQEITHSYEQLDKAAELYVKVYGRRA